MGIVPEDVAVSSGKSGIARRAQVDAWRSHPASSVRQLFIMELERQRRERTAAARASTRVLASRTPRAVLPRSLGGELGGVDRLDKCNNACTECTTCTSPQVTDYAGSGVRRRTRGRLQAREGA